MLTVAIGNLESGWAWYNKSKSGCQLVQLAQSGWFCVVGTLEGSEKQSPKGSPILNFQCIGRLRFHAILCCTLCAQSYVTSCAWMINDQYINGRSLEGTLGDKEALSAPC